MKRSITMLFLAALVGLGLGCAHKSEPPPSAAVTQPQAGPSASEGVPSMEVPETSFDFGKVKDTEGEVVHEFKIKNVGTGTLRLIKVLPG